MATPEHVAYQLRDEPGMIWLDDGTSGWSLVAFSPDRTSTDMTDWPKTGRQLTGTRSHASTDVPFTSGCMGWLGFEAAPAVGPFAAGPLPPEPVVHLSHYRGAMCFNHRTGKWHLPEAPDLRRRADELLQRAERLPAPRPAQWVPQDVTSEQAFKDGVRRVLDWILDGDHYQINLSHEVRHLGQIDAFECYRRLRARSPASYGAYLVSHEEERVLSNSPELFLSGRGRHLESRPIKGTRPRGASPHEDTALLDELRLSEKEIAELTMIVDLCRNDLGRVAVPGTVRVGARELSTHSNVHHAEQSVYAELRPALDIWDALGAAFPPGSVTGAPKVRAYQRIKELEATARGVYCGAIGFCSSNGHARWSVAIRTAIQTAQMVRYHIGSGLVADSDPTAEWEETLAKGINLSSALFGQATPGAGQ